MFRMISMCAIEDVKEMVKSEIRNDETDIKSSVFA